VLNPVGIHLKGLIQTTVSGNIIAERVPVKAGRIKMVMKTPVESVDRSAMPCRRRMT